jgi:outer membrane protein assembly factor BamB
VRDFSFPAVLDAGSGALLGAFSASGPAPAVDSTNVYDLSGSTLTASSLSSGAVRWSFGGDGSLTSAPLVAGGTVFIGGSSGKLYGLSSSTGRVIWSTSVGAPIPAPDEQNVSQPLTGFATSGGLLLVPAGNTLVAYR